MDYNTPKFWSCVNLILCVLSKQREQSFIPYHFHHIQIPYHFLRLPRANWMLPREFESKISLSTLKVALEKCGHR